MVMNPASPNCSCSRLAKCAPSSATSAALSKARYAGYIGYIGYITVSSRDRAGRHGEYAITASPHHSLLRWISFLLIAQGLALIPKVGVLAYYGRLSLLPWAVRWLPFVLLKRFFLLEALLAFSMRPVKPPRLLRERPALPRLSPPRFIRQQAP
jgi:hypothetical protein